MTADPAARRLAMLAALFAGPSRAFLALFRGEPFALALDLGCGTGHSTRLVAATLHPRRTVGLDSSPAYLRTARSRTRDPAVAYAEHDVTAPPFPGRKPDLVYSRHLLAHVPEPARVVERWVAELRPGGKLLLDEGASIHTSHEAIARYLEMLGGLLEHRGTGVDIARLLDGLAGRPGLSPCLSRDRTFRPPANKVAAMFRANMDAWVEDPFVTTHVGSPAVEWVKAELEALARAPVKDGVTWGLKQVAFRRGTVV
jgi:SAM-dependent methyltransferase